MKKNLLCMAAILSAFLLPFGVVFAAENTTAGVKTTNSTTSATNTTKEVTNTTVTNSTATTSTTKKTFNGKLTVTPESSEGGPGTKTITFAPDDATAEISSISVQFKNGKRIEDFKCVGNADWTATQQDTASGEIICTFKANGAKKKGSSLTLGTITFNNTVTADDTDADCLITATFKGAYGEINPDTGASLPYIVLIGGLLLAGVVYSNANKKTKLHKI